MKRLFFLYFSWLFLLSFSAAYSAEGRIAVLVPQNGSYATYGDLQMQGYHLAQADLAETNAPISVRYFDIGSLTTSLEEFISDKVMPYQPDVIVGPYSSGMAAQVVDILSQYDTPLLIPSATKDSITRKHTPNIFRLAVPSGLLADTVVSFIATHKESWNTQQIIVVAEKNSFSKSTVRALEQSTKKSSLPSIQAVYYESSDLDDILPALNKPGNVVIPISRSVDDCIKITEALQDQVPIIGFIAGFLTPAYYQHAVSKKYDVHVLSPWQDDTPSTTVQHFVQAFSNKYRSAFSSAHPQYHNVQAYSALVVAAEAWKEAAQTDSSIQDVLRQRVFKTPLGRITFADFGGYYQQSILSPVIQHFEESELKTVYPFDRAFKASQDLDRVVAKTSLLKTLLGNQFIALFAIIALGLILGNLKLFNLSLGASGVLFIALIFGHFHLTIPSGVGTLGLILFIFAAGIGAGPSFFRAFAEQGAQLATVSIVIVATAAAATILSAQAFSIPVDLAVGIFAGSLTSTPALAAAMDSLQDLGDRVSVGYGIAYPFGVIGVVLFVQLLPTLLRKDLATLARDLKAISSSHKALKTILVQVTNPNIIGKTIATSPIISASHCCVSRVLRNNELIPLRCDAKFEKEQILRLVGEEKVLQDIVDYIGPEVQGKSFQDHIGTASKLIVTSPKVYGKTIESLQLLKNYGVTITRITRNDMTFIPTEETIIEQHDQLMVVGLEDEVKQVAQFVGHKEKALYETDLLSLAVGLIAGVVIGLIPIGIGGAKGVAIGLSGGLLVVSLLLGHYGHIGRIVGRLPFASRMLMMELGLVFFLANAGVKAGGALMQTIGEYGLVLFFVSMLITVCSLAVGYLFATYALKMNLLQTLGGVCGGMTSTPAIGVIKSKVDSDVPVISYASAYPVALILMLFVAQILVAVLSKI